MKSKLKNICISIYNLKNWPFWTRGEVEKHGANCIWQKGTTTIGGDVFSAIGGEKIIVGNDGMISRDVWFFTGDGHGIINTDGIRINYSDDIIIGKHVWIGYRTI